MKRFSSSIKISSKIFNYCIKLFSIALITLFIISCSNASKDQYQGDDYPKLMVGVAQWRYEGGPNLDFQERTYHRLLEAISALNNVTLIQIPISIENADAVDQVALQYDLDVLVWGWYDKSAVRGYVDLANATTEDGKTNSLSTFLENGGSTEAIRVLKALGKFAYQEDGVSFCVPRWTP